MNLCPCGWPASRSLRLGGARARGHKIPWHKLQWAARNRREPRRAEADFTRTLTRSAQTDNATVEKSLLSREIEWAGQDSNLRPWD
jgi:hypothetical protein